MIYYWVQETASSLPNSLLTGGVVVGILGLIFAQLRHTQTLRQTRELEAERAERAQQLETERARETTLQKYFEQVGKLLIEQSLREATPGDNLSTVARAQTLAVLEGLDPERKRILLQFLYESDLIKLGEPVISMERANLRKANLSEINLEKAHLERANLERANLFETDLEKANLKRARLRKADLREADLREANLERARLREADLGGAKLRGAKNLSQQQINEATGDENTKLPDHLHRPAHWSKGGE